MVFQLLPVMPRLVVIVSWMHVLLDAFLADCRQPVGKSGEDQAHQTVKIMRDAKARDISSKAILDGADVVPQVRELFFGDVNCCTCVSDACQREGSDGVRGASEFTIEQFMPRLVKLGSRFSHESRRLGIMCDPLIHIGHMVACGS